MTPHKRFETMKSDKLIRRYGRIKALVLERGTASVDDLAEMLGVSRMTIHRDITHLESRGFLRKVRNGATTLPSSRFESSINFRLESSVPEKARIARAALDLVSPGEAVILDESTTLLPMLDGLLKMSDMTIITNFKLMIDRLSADGGESDTRLIALGGEFVPQFATFSGVICQAALSSIKADVYFTSVPALAGGVAYHPHPLIAEVKRTMMATARRRYLLFSSEKLGKTALHKVSELDDFDAIITDKAPDPSLWPDRLRDKTIVADKLPRT